MKEKRVTNDNVLDRVESIALTRLVENVRDYKNDYFVERNRWEDVKEALDDYFDTVIKVNELKDIEQAKEEALFNASFKKELKDLKLISLEK